MMRNRRWQGLLSMPLAVVSRLDSMTETLSLLDFRILLDRVQFANLQICKFAISPFTNCILLSDYVFHFYALFKQKTKNKELTFSCCLMYCWMHTNVQLTAKEKKKKRKKFQAGIYLSCVITFAFNFSEGFAQSPDLFIYKSSSSSSSIISIRNFTLESNTKYNILSCCCCSLWKTTTSSGNSFHHSSSIINCMVTVIPSTPQSLLSLPPVIL